MDLPCRTKTSHAIADTTDNHANRPKHRSNVPNTTSHASRMAGSRSVIPTTVSVTVMKPRSGCSVSVIGGVANASAPCVSHRRCLRTKAVAHWGHRPESPNPVRRRPHRSHRTGKSSSEIPEMSASVQSHIRPRLYDQRVDCPGSRLSLRPHHDSPKRLTRLVDRRVYG